MSWFFVESKCSLVIINSYDASTDINYSGFNEQIKSITFNNNGTKFYFAAYAFGTNDAILEYSLSTAWDLGSTVTLEHTYNLGSTNSDPISICFNDDGTLFFILDSTDDVVYEYTLGTAYDFSGTVTRTGNSYSFSSQDTSPRGFVFNDDGTKMFISGSQNDKIYEYTLSIGYDITSTVTYIDSISSVILAPDDIRFNSTGEKLYCVTQGADVVQEFNLTTGFDLSTASVGRQFEIPASSAPTTAMGMKPDATLFYMGNANTDIVYELELQC